MSRARLAQFFGFYIILVLITLVIGWIAATTIYWSIRWSSGPEATANGRMLARYEWPESLVELLSDVDKRHIQVEQLRVYSGPHDTYYWRCDATPGLLDLMIARWKLSPVDRNYKVVDAVLRNMPVALTSLNQGKDTAYYVSAEYLPGGEWKGHLYCVMNDKANKAIIVRYYYNF
jgi:hypothetical protein